MGGTCALLFALLAAAPAHARRRSLTVVATAQEKDGPIVSSIVRGVDGTAVSVQSIDGAFADPIRKGRFLAALQRQDLIVTVGNAPTRFVISELEGAPIFFVDANALSGRTLASKRVSGVFSYSVARLMDGTRGISTGTVGLLYTPGYEEIAGWIRKAASERRLALDERKVSAIAELAPAVRALNASSNVIWIAGDPMLMEGSAFDFILETSLAAMDPLVTAGGIAELRKGAFLSFEPERGALGEEASRRISELMSGRAPPGRVWPAPAAGVLLVNGRLSERWGLALPRSLPWRSAP